MSKFAIVNVIDKKIGSADRDSRDLEKQFAKGNISQKEFMDQYLAQRKDFHRYQILKVKVNQS